MTMAETSPLLVLSLWEPWAILTVAPDPVKLHRAAPKKWETRAWHPFGSLPLHVAIHATKKMDPEIRTVLGQWPFKDCLERCGYLAADPRPFVRSQATPPMGRKLLPLGAIVGVATITQVVRTETLLDRWGQYEDGAAETYAEEVRMGNYESGRYGWHLEETHALPEPIPFSGRQSALYPLPAAIEQQVWQQLAGVGVAR